VLRVILLLLKTLLERRQPRYDTADHKDQADHGPYDSPALRRAAIPLRENAGIGRVHFSQDEIIADIPNRVETRHNTDKELFPVSTRERSISPPIENSPQRIATALHA
jgi:hypothetical protein